uniref:Uncharacterized protein n=1 Tax=Arundo donax TaxID=35708 RepID=A0A0A8YTB2_ARUDO
MPSLHYFSCRANTNHLCKITLFGKYNQLKKNEKVDKRQR